MRKELTISELDDQCVELLPARETLHFHIGGTHVFAANQALAFNVASINSFASAAAVQFVTTN
jgi:hypothetical protein